METFSGTHRDLLKHLKQYNVLTQFFGARSIWIIFWLDYITVCSFTQNVQFWCICAVV